MAAITLTPREVAELARVPRRAVEKAIEEKVLTVHRRPAPLPYGRTERRFLTIESVAYVHLMRRISGEMSLSLTAKRRLARSLRAADGPVELAPAVFVDVPAAAGEALARAERYGAARERWIDSAPGVKGGAPIIRGTRLTAHSLAARVEAGDCLEEIVAENPDLPREAIETAIIFARSHPLAGRPTHKPAA